MLREKFIGLNTYSQKESIHVSNLNVTLRKQKSKSRLLTVNQKKGEMKSGADREALGIGK
jgi:hypothetical protein